MSREPWSNGYVVLSSRSSDVKLVFTSFWMRRSWASAAARLAAGMRAAIVS